MRRAGCGHPPWRERRISAPLAANATMLAAAPFRLMWIGVALAFARRCAVAASVAMTRGGDAPCASPTST